jgi:hypothetical protein
MEKDSLTVVVLYVVEKEMFGTHATPSLSSPNDVFELDCISVLEVLIADGVVIFSFKIVMEIVLFLGGI